MDSAIFVGEHFLFICSHIIYILTKKIYSLGHLESRSKDVHHFYHLLAALSWAIFFFFKAFGWPMNRRSKDSFFFFLMDGQLIEPSVYI